MANGEAAVPVRSGAFRFRCPGVPDAAGAGRLVLHARASAGRSRVESFIEGGYARGLGSILRRHYPLLVSLQDESGAIRAAAGVRFAREERLFLEQYLDEPVELAAAPSLQESLDRQGVAEIGSLASDGPGASMALFRVLAEHLISAGCSHAAATATRQLRRKFERMGFQTHALARARASRLTSLGDDWGRYYERDPEVLIGPIAPALARLNAMAERQGVSA